VLGEIARPPTKVLIVDDDDVFRQSLARILTGAGYASVEASDGRGARARLEAEPDIAAVLCDIRMTGESGLDLLAAITTDYPDLAVIMTTGVDDPSTAERAFETGAYGYLIKPFTTNEILIALAGALRRRELEADRRIDVRGFERNVTRLRSLRGVLSVIERGSPVVAADEEENMERLSRAVSLRDEETGGHIQRMSRSSALLAEAVGLSNGSADEVRLATALHDVGKIGVPDTILLKPGPLSPSEYTTMQRHTVIGFQLLAGSTSSLLSVAAAIALGHHEWWDGGGYPRGLRGEEIPAIARIAAVTDVFDALTSDRVYRPALSVDAALAMMGKLRGRQFEPSLLDAFLDLLDDVAAIREAHPDRDEEPRIRVLVVDDHEIFVQSLVRLLSAHPGIKVVGTAATAAAAQAAVVSYEPDVVLMDFELPDGDGATATAAVKALLPRTKVVMLTGRTDPEALIRTIGAGCSGFVAKTEGVERLVGAIASANAGEQPTPIARLPRLLAELPPTRRGIGADLGARELEVLRLVALGASNRAIAEQLYISLNTVRNHVQNALYKLHAHSKLEAVAIAVREGVIERGPRAADG
jgi:putative two-component system response regulator